MYVPAHFAVRDDAAAFALIEQNPFGLLVSAGPDGDPVASHIPFLLERGRGPRGTLVCHLAAANGQAALQDGARVFCVFQGVHGYISPTWYAKKPAVPTWNYEAVHAYGRAVATRDPAALRVIVDRLAQVHEGPGGWQLADEPEAFTAGMLRGIVGLTIEIDRLEAKRKLSQNRAAADVDGVLAALRSRGDDAALALADAMVAAAPRRA